ncbi:hypothetical protein D3C87_2037870 [compost metagenome]
MREGRSLASTLTRARSLPGSVPISLPLNFRPSGKVTLSSVAPATTWLLVTIRPSGRTTKPEPTPFC